MAQMTLRDLDSTCNSICTAFRLGAGSVRRSSAYIDYVAVEFACFPTPAHEAVVKTAFGTLMEKFGWTELAITFSERRNSISVIIHKSRFIATNDARMPAE